MQCQRRLDATATISHEPPHEPIVRLSTSDPNCVRSLTLLESGLQCALEVSTKSIENGHRIKCRMRAQCRPELLCVAPEPDSVPALPIGSGLCSVERCEILTG